MANIIFSQRNKANVESIEFYGCDISGQKW